MRHLLFESTLDTGSSIISKKTLVNIYTTNRIETELVSSLLLIIQETLVTEEEGNVLTDITEFLYKNLFQRVCSTTVLCNLLIFDIILSSYIESNFFFFKFSCDCLDETIILITKV